MIVHWDGHDLAEWDAVHTAAAGALQQGWDYGSSLKLLRTRLKSSCRE